MASVYEYQSPFVDLTATVAASASATDAIKTGGMRPVAVLFPATFTSATMTFAPKSTGSTYKTLNSGTVSVSADNWVGIPEATAAYLGDDFKINTVSAETAKRTLRIRCMRW